MAELTVKIRHWPVGKPPDEDVQVRLSIVEVRLERPSSDEGVEHANRPMWSELDGDVRGPAEWAWD